MPCCNSCLDKDPNLVKLMQADLNRAAQAVDEAKAAEVRRGGDAGAGGLPALSFLDESQAVGFVIGGGRSTLDSLAGQQPGLQLLVSLAA